MRSLLRRTLLPAVLALLVAGMWGSRDFQQIAAGVAIFLFGMFMLEDGFTLFAGGLLEKWLARATRSLPRSLLFGMLTTSLMQSSSLVSVISISFLSAGLISLRGGVGIIFGANIGSTTGAWLVAGFGLKVDISAFALPMLAFAIVLVFPKAKAIRGLGYVLAGLGFLLLGIHHMKEGFDSFKDQFDLSQFAIAGLLGLVVYTLIGMLATVVMQSSHTTMVLTITALAAGQVTYDNALALAIGANIGTTVTAVVGAATANYQGRRLALAHVIFNGITAAVALALVVPLRELVTLVSDLVGIAPDDYTLQLAVFHSIFNVLGVALLIPAMRPFIVFLERTIPAREPGVSEPRYLSESVAMFPATMQAAVFKEVEHLVTNATELIAHGLNLRRSALYAADDAKEYVASARETFDLDFDTEYEQRIKFLHSAILEFVSHGEAGDLPYATVQRLTQLREAAEHMVRAVKEVKHMRGNTSFYTASDRGAVTTLYNALRADLGRILVELHRLAQSETGPWDVTWLEQDLVRLRRERKSTRGLVAELVRQREISPLASTSYLNDATYAYRAMKEMLEAGRLLYSEPEDTMAEVERLLEMDEQVEVDRDEDSTVAGATAALSRNAPPAAGRWTRWLRWPARS